MVLTGLLYLWIPKGFFPEQDTGLISGQSEAGQDVSFAEMKRRQEALGAIVQQDPAVASIVMSLGGSKSGQALNAGRVFITLKPLSERDASAQQVIARLRPKRVFLIVLAIASGLVAIPSVLTGVDQAIQPYTSILVLLTAVLGGASLALFSRFAR